MKHTDLISVIVPVYNIAPWICRCVESIQAQTYENLEIILVDDGSTDDGLKICHALAKADSRIRVCHKENGGLASARLAGIEIATGDWITFVDGDDMVEASMYQHLLDNGYQYEADISHCGYVLIYPDGKMVYSDTSGQVRIQDTLSGLRDLLEEKLIQPSVCTKLYKRGLFSDIQGKYTEDIWNNEDMLLNFYLFSKAKRCVFEAFCPYLYCLREGSLSRRKPNAHTIYDPILVKQRIQADCPPELIPDLHRAMMSTCLFSYAQLCRGMEKEYVLDRQRVRSIIRQQFPNWRVLSIKQVVMAWVVGYLPVVFAAAYNLYYLSRRSFKAMYER